MTEKDLSHLTTLLDDVDSQTFSAFFKLMSKEIRFQLIYLLAHEGKLCVSDLATLVNSSVATTSHHLQILKKNNLIKSERDGKQIMYYTDHPKIMHFVHIGLDFTHIS
ncbi:MULTISPECIES: metalloregulator ArsR/SmtB family transcription factor [Vagococcus]|uniref:ArsR/SmtB family transcription factor n=1 Tax=Vagococcus TaxID=2737 RepID=UPI002FCBC747